MSEVVLELIFNSIGEIIGGIFEIFADSWIGDFTCPDSKGSRIFWAIVIVVLGVVIWREWR